MPTPQKLNYALYTRRSKKMIDNLYPNTGPNQSNNEVKTDISKIQAQISEIYQKLYQLTVKIDTGIVNANIGNFGILN
jgi:hypothetical protein